MVTSNTTGVNDEDRGGRSDSGMGGLVTLWCACGDRDRDINTQGRRRRWSHGMSVKLAGLRVTGP